MAKLKNWKKVNGKIGGKIGIFEKSNKNEGCKIENFE